MEKVKKPTPKQCAFNDMKKEGLCISLFVWEKNLLRRVDGRMFNKYREDKKSR